jgi:uncharacterized protein YdiU (UPF0061 family)
MDSLALENRFAQLPEQFFERIQPTPVPNPYLVAFSPDAAALVDLEPGAAIDPAFLAFVAGNAVPAGADPLAMAYAGHQFGVFVPQLGDGRAILMGGVTNRAGEHWELQLKGSGQTRWSRFGDGRSVLRSAIREFLCSEAMAGLGIPTTRALAIAGSDLPVLREEPETAAVLVRMAPSHVRFGSFEYFAARREPEAVRQLADWVITEFHPDLVGREQRHAAWLTEVCERTARLVAAWMAAGWSHGVLNTDNMSILGLTIDYGPFGFMDRYEAGLVCNHSDHGGRYAYDQQPAVGLWNLTRLAEALLTLVSEPDALTALNRYQPVFQTEYQRLMRAKLGLGTEQEDDQVLAWDLLELLQTGGADYTVFFRALGRFNSAPGADHAALLTASGSPAGFEPWAARYGERLRVEGSVDAERSLRMARVNPAYVLRNWLAERAIQAARTERDFGELERLRVLLRDPYTERPGMETYAGPPPAWGRVLAVSCSS